MNFRKINNITGWVVGLIACMVYFLSREATGSFWDCGEFVSSAYKMQLPHPPGAPFFTLLGRFFIILFGDHPDKAAHAVNLMSAMASGFTILFLFWTVTHFARKMFVAVGEEMTTSQLWTVMSAGVLGAFAYCFSDSFWYSAVEGEVYALSSFFTALVFWAMLKWEHADEKAGVDEAARNRSDRWIVFLFFMMGLSIGVHLLNLLTIPAIVMIYYFRRFKYSAWGAFFAFVVGCALTGLVQVLIIQYSMKAAGAMDIIFVNNFHYGFFSGFAFYFIAVAAMIVIGLRFRDNNINKLRFAFWLGILLVLLFLPFITNSDSGFVRVVKLLFLLGLGFVSWFFNITRTKGIKLALWCYAFMMLGYSAYFTTLIRSNANPSIDMNNVDNPMSLVYYLSREQYGEAPLLYGPHFAADYKEDPDNPGHIKFIEKEMRYVKGKDRYIPIGKAKEPDFRDEDKQFFPRIWDRTEEQGHARFYADWLNLYDRDARGNVTYAAPTYSDNMQWFFQYQMGLMYWRYFMWNFAGKQNDLQGTGNVRDGNWITGISFIDNQMLGDQSKLPDSSKNNKSHNTLYLLPFLLGMIGCIYQFLRNRKDWVTVFLLFFLTGIAVVLYLNQPGLQPRERDYAYVGSFYAYAMWIGLGIPALLKLIKLKADRPLFNNMFIYGGILTLLIVWMSEAWHLGNAVMAGIMIAALYVLVTGALILGIRAMSTGGTNEKTMNLVLSVIALAIPLLMLQQEWDDHDRSKKHLAADVAKDYLQSCDKNAILITFGDNDTYPLWYAQEVEGVRPDIRIINNSLLGIDWYINQLRYKVNESPGIDVIWTPEQIEGDNRAYISFVPDPKYSQTAYFPLYDAMKNFLGKRVTDPETGRDVGPGSFPVRRFYVPVDTALVMQNGTAHPGDSVLSRLEFEIPMQGQRLDIQRNDWMILAMIASNNWKRPIYFTSPYPNLGFIDYLQKDGLTYRLVPYKVKNPVEGWLVRTYMRGENLDVIKDNLMNKFVFTSKKGAYFDEENRRHALNIRGTYAEAAGNMSDGGRQKEGLQLIEKAESLIDKDDLPYAMISGRSTDHNVIGLQYLEAAYKAGDTVLARKVSAALKKDMEQQRTYYEYLKTEREELYAPFDGQDGDATRNEQFLYLLTLLQQKYDPKSMPPPINERPQTPIISNKPDSSKDTSKKKK